MSISMMPNGNVAPSRFVKLDSTQLGGYCLQAGSGDKVIGVAEPGVRQPPIVGLDDGFAGIQNSNAIEIFTTNDECWVECGGAVNFGDLLKPDANGRAVTAGSDGDFFGAIALQQSTASQQLVRCRIQLGFRGA